MRSSDLAELVGEGGAVEDALTDGLNTVEPAIPIVAGLELGGDVDGAARRVGVDPALVLEEDEGAVVGLHEGPHVDGAGAVGTDRQPVGGRPAFELGPDALALDRTGLDLEDQPV